MILKQMKLTTEFCHKFMHHAMVNSLDNFECPFQFNKRPTDVSSRVSVPSLISNCIAAIVTFAYRIYRNYEDDR